MTRRKIRIAIIGLGYWGSKLLAEYLALKNIYEVVGVADIYPRKLFQPSFLLPPSAIETTNINQILLDPTVEAVHLATPIETHYRLAAQALVQGKHVLVEKPMACTFAEAKNLVHRVESNGRVLHVDHLFRFNNALQHVKRAIGATNIVSVKVEWETLFKPSDNRSIVYDLAPHPSDILHSLVGKWPTSVSALGNPHQAVSILLKFPNNLFASISLSWVYYGYRKRHVTIETSHKTITVDALNQIVTVSKNGLTSHTTIYPNNTIRDTLINFSKAINGKNVSNHVEADAFNIAILEAIDRSLQKGGVKINIRSKP